MTFVRNCWYVAGWSHAIPRELSTLRIMNEDIVLFRTRNGELVALEDQCPHKRLPLSMGRLKGDAVECGYHGMTFGAGGRCVRIPGQDNLPDSARVRAYPVREVNGVAWIWMGDPALAETAPVFELPQWTEAGWAPHYGDGLRIAANYLHLADNLCDPAHVAYVHPTTLGNPESEDVPVEVQRDDRTVVTSRWIRNAPPIGFFKALDLFKGNVDRWHYYHYHAPNIAVIDFGSIETERNAEGDNRHLGARLFAVHCLTPVSETETIDFWMHVRNIGVDDPEMGDRMNAQFRLAFDEDKLILEAIQKREATPLDRRPVRLAIDKGPNFLRKIIGEMADLERPGKAAAE